ncbi:hypothetical protein GNP80_08905 [Aliivibrio fischeri]|uniref:hypothetical protein n=1 Tax=Aliivibrio fischeri TaxID=668 RepID=UPI0012D9322A|nr:hypothetical protein [Aliivibrio fischeri]MUK92560.1 hypothetical protein [Aliivibrio fischeri]
MEHSEQVLNVRNQIQALSKSKDIMHYQKRYLLSFSKFIDNPFTNNKAFTDLYFCNSRLKPLQRRQRITLVKVVTTLMSKMEAEHYQIGHCEEEDMKTTPHYWFINQYEKLWKESITKSKWFRCIKQLKLAEFLEVEAVFVYNPELTPEEAGSIQSVAAYKSFTRKFIEAFKLEEVKDVIESKLRCIQDRIKKKLSNIWFAYIPFSDSYITTKVNKVIKHKQSQLGSQPSLENMLFH